MSGTAEFLGTVARAELLSGDGDWGAAAELWSRITDMNPVNGEYWARLADARFENKRFEAAISAYAKVLELGTRATFRQRFAAQAPELIPGEVAYRIACCYASLGDHETAIAALAAAIDKGFRDLDRAQSGECWQPLLGDDRVRDLLGILDTTELSRDEGWRADLKLLAREIKRRAYAPFKTESEADFDARVASLNTDIPDLDDAHILVRMMRLVRHLDDGHAFIAWPKDSDELSRLLPVDLFGFPEGLHIIATGPGHEHLLGAKVERIGGRSLDEVAEAFDEIIPRDNLQQVACSLPVFLRHTAMLYGLGLIDDLRKAALTVRLPDGAAAEVTLTAEPGKFRWNSAYPPGWRTLAGRVPRSELPLHLRNRELPYWFEYLPESGTVYFQYNGVRDHPAEPFAAFCDRLFGFIEDRRSARLAVDLRWNPGGDTFLAQPLLHNLIASRIGRQRGSLYVIIGRLTFSAAQNTATAIDRETNAIFVGEPTGSRPNFIGEAIPFELPYSKTRVNVADLYWETSWPWDHRTWIAPDIYTPPTFEAYRRNEDPAMQAILAIAGQYPGVR